MKNKSAFILIIVLSFFGIIFLWQGVSMVKAQTYSYTPACGPYNCPNFQISATSQAPDGQGPPIAGIPGGTTYNPGNCTTLDIETGNCTFTCDYYAQGIVGTCYTPDPSTPSCDISTSILDTTPPPTSEVCTGSENVGTTCDPVTCGESGNLCNTDYCPDGACSGFSCAACSSKPSNVCTGLYCGDGICSSQIGENSANCAIDCGVGGPPPGFRGFVVSPLEPSPQSIYQGQSTSYNFSVTLENDFGGAVVSLSVSNFPCPADATCNISPSSFVVGDNETIPVVLDIVTTETTPPGGYLPDVTATDASDPTITGSGSGFLQVNSAISGVTALCNSPLQVNQTELCAATVSGVGSYNPAVTWSTTSGSINSSGNYTAPGTPTTAVITATSQQDPTQVGTTTVQIVSAPVPPTNTASLNAMPSPSTAASTTTFTAMAGGTAVGTINYSFWWNCSNPTTDVATAENDPSCGTLVAPVVANSCGAPNANGEKCDGVAATTESVTNIYAAAGSYSPKVIIERGSAAPAQSQFPLTVNASAVPTTHFECVTNACTSVSGAGINRCNIADGNADCGNPPLGNSPIYGVCDPTQDACVNAAVGSGPPCSSDVGLCGGTGGSGTSHLGCENDACVIVGPSITGLQPCTTIGTTCSGSTGPIVLHVAPRQTVPVGTVVTIVASGGTGIYNTPWTSPGMSGATPSGPGNDTLTGTYTAPGVYSVSVTDSSGNVGNTVITVVAPSCTFTANPMSIVPPQSSTLSWDCTNAVACTINGNAVTSVLSGSNLTGSLVVQPGTKTNYSLSCSGSGSGPDNISKASTTVSVSGPGIIEITP